MLVLLGLSVAGALVTAESPAPTDPPAVRIASRVTDVSTRDGITRTVIDDTVVNDWNATVHARYVLRVPVGAVVTRVAIVDDGAPSRELIAPETRDDITQRVARGTARPAPDVAPTEDDSITVDVSPLFVHDARRVVVGYEEPSSERLGDAAELTLGERGFVLRAAIGRDASDPESRAIAIDVSRGVTHDALAAEVALAKRILARAQDGQRFVLLACDSACDALPAVGLTTKTTTSIATANEWLDTLRRRGSRDLAGGIADAASRVVPGGQVIWLGVGKATAGELAPVRIASRIRTALGDTKELRIVALGEHPELERLARDVGATFDAIAMEQSLDQRIGEIAERMRQLAIITPTIDLDAALAPFTPRTFGSVAAGDAIAVVGRVGTLVPASIVVRARVGGSALSVRLPTRVVARSAEADTLLAGARIRALERRRDHASLVGAAELALTHRLLAESSAWDALERDAAFRASARAWLAQQPPVHHYTKSISCPTLGEFTLWSRVPSETIQYVVRQNAGRFRACYEAGLRAHPGLSGRVATRFVIESDGVVSSAEDWGSDLADPETIDCIGAAFRAVKFPDGDPRTNQRITVVYPFVFTPPENVAYAPGALLPLRVPKSELPDPHELWLLRWHVEDAPQDADANEALVRALDALGKTDESLSAAEEFVEAAPEEPRAYEMLASRAPLRRAAEAIDALADLSSACSAPHARAAKTWQALGERRRAAAHRTSAGVTIGRNCR